MGVVNTGLFSSLIAEMLVTSVLPRMDSLVLARRGRLVCGALLLFGFATAHGPALADPTAPDGSITFIREVPARYAYLPGEPGDVHYVRTDPSEHVFGALQGLQPLSDAEAAGVHAESSSARDQAVGTGADALGTALMAGSETSRSTMGGMNGGMAGNISGSIAQGTSALSSALGALGTAMGAE